MNIPLDRLYHYIESVAEEVRGDSIIIYHFYPHGSKNIDNLVRLNPYEHGRTLRLSPNIICNDQEPLNFSFYEQYEGNIRPRDTNFPGELVPQPNNVYSKLLLLHSEQHSAEVEKYSHNNFIPVYYWCHAIIALDWFRFAMHIRQKKDIKKQFLIYNRAWSGTREYRLGFADQLIRLGLNEDCLMRVSPVDSTLNKHYDLHQFERPEWRPGNVIENYFPVGAAESHYSADFDIEDYNSTNIEVVLETIFDDQRVHLTEKTLRPIALGQPFMLVGPPNSLKYLRSYGFKTFADCWDESYDMMTDSTDRMSKITEIMKQISRWDEITHEQKLAQAQSIADYNKKHFFSKEFFELVVGELRTNLESGLTEVEKLRT